MVEDREIRNPVWFERSYYFKMMTTPPSLGEATNWIADLAVFDHAATFGAKKARGLGKAGTRTQAQKVAARAYGADLIAGIKPKSLVAFTDGASKGNPGPSGAGAYLYDNIPPYWDRESSAALGHGTNNLGELWGLGMALQMAKERVLSHPNLYNHLYIFTDSQFSLGIVTEGWRSRSHPDLAMKLKLLVRHFPIPITIAWVPAHCGIDSNERADELADRGAITSGKKGADVDPSSDFTSSNFVPRIYDG
jgi:ribonuclease HI